MQNARNAEVFASRKNLVGRTKNLVPLVHHYSQLSRDRDSEEDRKGSLFQTSAPFFLSFPLPLSLSFARSSTLDEVKVPTLKLAKTVLVEFVAA